jgi:hypothetical protein
MQLYLTLLSSVCRFVETDGKGFDRGDMKSERNILN